MPFTIVLDYNSNFHLVKTKISCDFWFAFESTKKEVELSISPSDFDNCKNFASKFRRIYNLNDFKLNLVSF